jgi:formate-dependent nitrite reductase membrane component NrfD
MVMSYYTGTLLGATSTPLWAAAHRLLPPLFAASATTVGTAAILLGAGLMGAPSSTCRRLQALALVAGATQLAIAVTAELRWRWRGLSGPLERPRFVAARYGGALGLGIVLPCAVYAAQLRTGASSRAVTALAAVAALAGGYVERAVILFAGNESARRAEDYLRFTQPEQPGVPAVDGSDGSGEARDVPGYVRAGG